MKATRSQNDAPEFPDQDLDMDEDQSETADRTVAENTAAGEAIGDPIVAEDDDGDVLTYTLYNVNGEVDGGDAALFAIDWATGQLKTKGKLDFEDDSNADDEYTVIVRATDPDGMPEIATANTDNSDVITVTIMVTGVDEAPVVSGDAAITFAENGQIANPLDTYMADDPEETDNPTLALTGADRGKFTFENGDLTFTAAPDYEKPGDADKDNVYEVTVEATDAVSNTGTKNVKITVTNVDEDGMVTMSQLQPRVGVAITASVTDLDGDVSNVTWQWSRSQTDPGTFTDIDKATSATYKPVEGDADPDRMFLRATAMYTDGFGEGESAMGESANAVAVDTRNKPPVFDDQDDDTKGVQNDETTREVAENSNANVGSPVTATDPDPNSDALDYTLSGADAGLFSVGPDDPGTPDVDETGQIMVKSGTKLDYETKQTYSVTLKAADSFGDYDTIVVTIMVTDMNEAPEISEGGLAISSTSTARVEYAENGEGMVATYTASGPDASMATWSLDGDDAGDFRISSSGELTFRSSPDYENAADDDMDNTYMVTVMADDGTYMDTHDVTVMVTNVDEDGMVTLSAMQPRVGTPIMATLTDLDGDVTGETWQWARSSDMSAWTDIEDATSDSYTPVEADANMYLRATATYTDGHGPDKSKMAVTANMVVHLAISGMSSVEYAENGAEMVATYSASGPDAASATWTLEGDDAEDFEISSDGVLTFVSAPDYENAADADMDNTYMVTVIATDSANTAMHDVTVMVTDVEDTMTVIGGTLLDRFDSNDNDMIDKVDVTQVIRDYLFGDGVDPSRADVVAVIRLYLFQS